MVVLTGWRGVNGGGLVADGSCGEPEDGDLEGVVRKRCSEGVRVRTGTIGFSMRTVPKRVGR